MFAGYGHAGGVDDMRIYAAFPQPASQPEAIAPSLVRHGNPGERRLLPANTLVVLVPASNLPPDSPIKYWAHPVEGHPWPAETKAWAEDVGVGLHADDVAFVKMPAFPLT